MRLTGRLRKRFVLGILMLTAITGLAQDWVVLLNGTGLNGWTKTGTANWRVGNGFIEATSGNGILVSTESYDNFQLRAEFWVDRAANSGIFLRSAKPEAMDSLNSYEVNIYDARPDPSGGTGAIVDVAPPLAPVKAANQWNTFEITADGPHLVVVLNGVKTVDVMNDQHTRGKIGLQHQLGVVRFRRVEIRRLP